ncbi:MAG: hypothetical protein QXP55_03820 [Nitrososphaerales archaeon]
MSEQISSEIESVMIALYELEKELDKVKARVESMKKELISFAQEEAKRARNEALDEVKKQIEDKLAKVKANAEKEVEDILAKNEEKIKELKAKVKKVYDQAIDMVLKVVLGEGEIP